MLVSLTLSTMKYLLLFCFLFPLLLPAQSIHISGTVQTYEENLPLAYAQLRARQSGLGSLTNADGQFHLVLPGGAIADTLKISYLGYATAYLPVASVRGRSDLTILLQQKDVVLDEVLITPQEPEELLLGALAAIRDNYADQGTRLEGFYRELIREEDQYLEFTEAVLDLYQSPVEETGKRSAQVRLVKGRQTKKPSRSENINYSLGAGGPEGLAGVSIQGDPNSQHFLDPDHFKLYDYTLVGIVEYGDRLVYHLSFDQDKRTRRKLYAGDIYLDLRTLAFVSIQFRLSEVGKKYRLSQLDGGLSTLASVSLMRAFGYDLQILEEEGRLDYQLREGIWYLSYCRMGLDLLQSYPAKSELGAPVRVLGQRELAITSVQPAGSTIPATQQLDGSQGLGTQIGTYDEAFWEQYNYIRPTTSLQEIAKTMQ